MKKHTMLYFTILFMLILVNQLTAQNKIPAFEMPLYFEDAKGNKDSIIVGFDENADYVIPDPLFGEDKLNTPFDSIFEVRVVKSTSYWDSPITGKKRIDRAEKSVFGSFSLSILINAKYNPIKITCNKDLLKSTNPYLNRTILAKTTSIFLSEQGWEYGKDWVCLAGQKQLSIDISKKEGGTSWNERMYMVKGKTALQKIKFLTITQFGSGPSCEKVLSAEEIQTVEKLNIYPNPAQNDIKLQIPQNILFTVNSKISIIDINGKIIREQFISDTNENINIEQIPSGIYFLKLTDEKKIIAVGKFVKE